MWGYIIYLALLYVWRSFSGLIKIWNILQQTRLILLFILLQLLFYQTFYKILGSWAIVQRRKWTSAYHFNAFHSLIQNVWSLHCCDKLFPTGNKCIRSCRKPSLRRLTTTQSGSCKISPSERGPVKHSRLSGPLGTGPGDVTEHESAEFGFTEWYRAQIN